MKGKRVRSWNILVIILVIVLIAPTIYFVTRNTSELKTIKSAKQLEKIYEGKTTEQREAIAKLMVGMPFSILAYQMSSGEMGAIEDVQINGSYGSSSVDSFFDQSLTSSASSDSSSKDYSTTNIQVENVDEADITKTDGDYIYSISEDTVVITDVRNPEEIKVVAKVSLTGGSLPEDLILYNNKLVIISRETNSTSSYYRASDNTVVSIYDITTRETPRLLKHYKLYEPYYTSRCIDSKLYVISSGTLRKEDGEMVTYYTENYEQKDIGFDHIHYLKDVDTRQQTLISMMDLSHLEQDVYVNSYLMDISNAYVSENSIYLLDQEYERNNYAPPISSLFGPWGALGPFKYDEEIHYYGTDTKIFKFNILEDGSIQYSGHTKVKGSTINQYSLDEYEGNLRIALTDYSGSRVVIFDKNLNQLGETPYLAKGETMYSSRFMGNKAYLVTYKTMDPLYVIDLSNPTKPKVLGELKIPGYSAYLHPYDENHIIGIGMETKETVNRDYLGRVTSTTAKVVGMKMALFDVSDVQNPIQMSSVVIGDSRTTSAILTNPKALLFSKEKELIAIPVNNYAEDFNISNSENYESVISAYTNYRKSYIAEGYAVYKLNLTDGFKLKGMITHEKDTTSSYNTYRTTTKLLRGLYIDKNLYTVSENMVKVNDLDTLKIINEIHLK